VSKLNLKQIFKSVGITLKKHSPEILTGLGIAGGITTVVLAVGVTPKVIRKLEEEKVRKVEESEAAPADPTLTKGEVVKIAWKYYIPAAITGSLSIACVIGATSVNNRRNAAIAAAYTLSETALKDYQNKVAETFGEKKELAVRDAVAKDKVDRNPVSTQEVIITERGNTLCYDVISGRYFKSDIEKLKRAANELNRRMLNEMYISLNEFYYEIGLSGIKAGEDLGWNVDKGLIDLRFSAQVADDGNPCLVVEFDVAPKYNFSKIM
jgi:hypothetical protein